MAIIIAYIFGIVLHDYTGLHPTGSLYAIDEITGERYLDLRNLVLPAITLGIRPLAIITQLTRSSMLDVLGQDYIRTAYAKGLKPSTVVIVHALKNSLIPVATILGPLLAGAVTGALITENIFAINGMGRQFVLSIGQREYFLLTSLTLLFAVLLILGNLMVDIIYAWLDPRIRFD